MYPEISEPNIPMYCSITECRTKHHAKGYCKKHYMRKRRKIISNISVNKEVKQIKDDLS